MGLDFGHVDAIGVLLPYALVRTTALRDCIGLVAFILSGRMKNDSNT
jgi:hypothetical protein